jgi:hypothetical protein
MKLFRFSIEQFGLQKELVLLSMECFYNKSIETKIVLTIDNFVHLSKIDEKQP